MHNLPSKVVDDKRCFFNNSDERNSPDPMAINLPPLAALSAFDAAARHLSFKKAAEELSLTPSSVSHQIRGLEERLGVRLFTRFNREVALTKDGVQYLAAISPALADIGYATSQISRKSGEVHKRARIVVSANSGFVDCWLSARLPAFTARHPTIELEVNYGEDFADYRNRDADIAIHYNVSGAPSGDSQILFKGVEFPVCSPDLRVDGRKLTDPRDLSRVDLIHEHDRIGWRRWLQSAKVDGVDASNGAIFQNTHTIFSRVAACDGVGLADDFVAYDAIQAGTLVKPFAQVRPSDWTVYLMRLKHGTQADAAAQFIAWLLKAVEEFRHKAAALRTSAPYPETWPGKG